MEPKATPSCSRVILASVVSIALGLTGVVLFLMLIHELAHSYKDLPFDESVGYCVPIATACVSTYGFFMYLLAFGILYMPPLKLTEVVWLFFTYACTTSMLVQYMRWMVNYGACYFLCQPTEIQVFADLSKIANAVFMLFSGFGILGTYFILFVYMTIFLLGLGDREGRKQ